MELIPILLVAGATFGVCWLFDKGFQKLFRSKPQHKSGHAVRAAKRNGLFGLILMLVGILAIITGIGQTVILWVGGCIVLLMGLGLCAYYLGFGIFYDDDTFLCTALGKKAVTYRFSDIKAQQLYAVTGGNILIELHLTDGKTLQLQSSMEGVYDFLDAAFSSWCRQTGRDPLACAFHDPANSCWFPNTEDV